MTKWTVNELAYAIKGEGYNVHESPSTDPYAATRRAIVRAAAEIGKTQVSNNN